MTGTSNNATATNNSLWRTQARSPRWQPSQTNRGNLPVLGEVRVHKRTGIMYIYDLARVSRSKEMAKWLRYDTWVWHALHKFPYKTARVQDLRKFDRRHLHLAEGPITLVHTNFS